MALAPGFHDVPPGHLAAVVTHLEMREPATPRPAPLPEGATIRRVPHPDTVWYRDLYRRIGSDWLWFSRLTIAEADLAGILSDEDVEIWVLDRGGVAEGLLELDFRDANACELAFFGVAPDLAGTGAGRCLMNHALGRLRDRAVHRFHVHTCTLDHPRALDFYRRSGFQPVRQQVEILPDPRLTGTLPGDAAAHIPLFAETPPTNT